MDEFKVRCLVAGIKEPVVMRMGWVQRNHELIERIKRDAGDRKIFVYQSPRTVRSIASALLAPRRAVFNKFVSRHGEYYRIKLGYPPHNDVDSDAPCELDLYGKASIPDAFDVGTVGDLFFGQNGFITAMAEAMDKPFIAMFARAGLESSVHQANHVTPERAFHKKHLATAVYDDMA
jgi:hypothetical protein